jgi:hypothetical protein
MTRAEYQRLRRGGICTACARRRSRPGYTKCRACSDRQKKTDALGAKLRKYGVTAADEKRMRRRQCGRCPVCHKKLRKDAAIDHAHGRGDARGLVCRSPCNPAIGGTDPELFQRARGLMQYAAQRAITLALKQLIGPADRRRARGRTH